MGCRYPPHERDHQRSAGILPAASAPGILPGGPNASQEGQTPTKTTFAYDALHLRIARHESSTTTTTFFVYEGWSRAEGSEARQTNGDSRLGRQPRVRGRSARVNSTVITEYTATPTDAKGATPLPPSTFTLHTSNVWGEDLSGTLQGAGGIGGLLASTLRTAPTTKNKAPSTPNVFYHYDSNGNIVLLTHSPADLQNSTLATRQSSLKSLPGKALIAAQYRYDAFGRTIKAEGPLATVNRYQFSTKPIEAESGLVYYGYRYLDTTHGRWISRDPIGDGHDGSIVLAIACASKYNMVANDTLNVIDVYGLDLSLPTSSCCARSAIPVALADGPEPGPADAISLGILAAAAGLWIGETLTEYAVDPLLDVLIPTDLPADTCGVCPPCPPAPNGGARVDYVPPSTPHWPCLGDHTHLWYFEMHQIPYPNCSCFAKKIKWVKCNDTGVWHDEN